MPLLVALALVLVAFLVAIALMPLGLVQRYRSGTARRLARPWLARVNIAALLLSVLLFLSSAAVTGIWVSNALSYSLAGLAGGCLLGLFGLRLTEWDRTSGKLHYTPNRFLVLALTLLVTARIAYGFWRVWQGWSSAGEDQASTVVSTVPGSLAAGAIVLAYTLTFWIGIARRCRQPER